ncbi:zinc-finger domain-containing protein [Zavarzinia sp.]|uniref:zinc-finger domain-containing protein n=1 Tax=Zavarzinia sp. TaxID=2027920 RepID=UPI0035618019
MASEAPETKEVETPIVACDGGEGALGHPRVYLNMEGKGEIQCPYCGRLYLLKGGAHAHAH